MGYALILFIVTGCWAYNDTPRIEIQGAVNKILGPTDEWGVHPGRTVKLICRHTVEYVQWIYPEVSKYFEPKEELLQSLSQGLEGLQITYDTIHPDNTGLHRCTLKSNPNIKSDLYLNVSASFTWWRGYSLLPGVGCYKLHTTMRPWSAAQSVCESEDSHLVVPETHHELRMINEIVMNYTSSRLTWLSVRRTGEWTTVHGKSLNISGVLGWNPKTFQGYGSCVFLDLYALLDNPCVLRKFYICEQIPDNFTCQSGFQLVPDVGCYMMSDNQLTWENARTTCEDLGAHLAVPNSKAEVKTLRKMANIFHTTPWLGIYRTNEMWTTLLSEAHRISNSPNWSAEISEDLGDCIYVTGYSVAAYPCNTQIQFICERDPDWVATEAVAPRITVEGLTITRILGTNVTEWAVQSGRRVTLTCEPEYGSVQWEYPQVENSFAPTLMPYLWSDAEGQSLTYNSVQPNNMGFHRCYLQENANISTEIYLNVSDDFIYLSGYDHLPGVGCYKTFLRRGTWDNAQAYCESRSAHVPAPLSWLELWALKDVISSTPEDSSFWVEINTARSLSKANNAARNLLDHQSGLPEMLEDKNESRVCISLDRTGLSYNPCDRHNWFICEKNEDCWAPGAAITPRIEIVSNPRVRILGTNGTSWGVEAGNRVTLKCTSVNNVVEWIYPKVHKNIQPVITSHIWDNLEGKLLMYDSIQHDNKGIHQCWIRDNFISAMIYLEVSANFTTKKMYDILPGIGSYKKLKFNMTWNHAKTHCAAEGAHLAMASSQRELNALLEMVNYDDEDSNFWLGVSRTGTWAAVGDQKYENFDFLGWTPEVTKSHGSCIVLINGGPQNYPCTKCNYFFCKHAPADSSCQPGYIKVSPVACYRFSKTCLTWHEAQLSCHLAESDLAVPDSKQVMHKLLDIIDSPSTPVWMGIHRINEKWTTVEGEPQSIAKFTEWLPDHSNNKGDCVYLNRSGVYAAKCGMMYYFICEQTQDLPSKKADTLLQWWKIFLISGLSTAAVILITVLTVLSFRRHQENILRCSLLQGERVDNPLELSLIDQLQLLPFNKQWEFPTKHLELGGILGAGEFGIVRKAQARFLTPGQTVTTVAVKTLNAVADMSCLKTLVLEMKILSHLGQHLNVVNFLGACTKELGKGKLHIIVEYCPYGSTRNYLINHHDTYIDQVNPSTGALRNAQNPRCQTNSIADTSDRKAHKKAELEVLDSDTAQTVWVCGTQLDAGVLSTRDLMIWSYQVAKGMEYLASRKVMHGDLAARNVLLTDNNVVKICDFGLARNLCDSNYYRKKNDDLLPVKWLSPEALLNQKFSTQSDIWAFGILLWEFFTLGASPYPGVSVSELHALLQDGYHMEQPKLAPHEIYQVMQRCWHADPQHRPAFSILSCELGDLLEEGIVENYMKLNKPYMKTNETNTEKDYLKELCNLPLTTSLLSSYRPSPREVSSRGPLPPLPVDVTII